LKYLKKHSYQYLVSMNKIESIYIHIPFCKNICSYCDFCKIYYHEALANKYLDALHNEIVKNYKKEPIKTLYIGGGTPSSLNIKQLKKLFAIIKQINLTNDFEFTFELNPEDLTEEKLQLLKQNKVNRISIGIQTFNPKYLKLLGRSHTIKQLKEGIKLMKKLGFANINLDLIYGLPGQSFKEFKKDIKILLSLKPTHISTYSLILEPHTILYINNAKSIDEDLEYKMYQYIGRKLKKKKFIHYEISNFAKEGFTSKHNLNYWNNNEYYGFGLGAHGFTSGIRYENTRSINNYLKGKYLLKKHKLSKQENMENELILGLRKIKGISIEGFKEKFNQDIDKVFKVDLLKKENGNYSLYLKDLYIMNEILEKILS